MVIYPAKIQQFCFVFFYFDSFNDFFMNKVAIHSCLPTVVLLKEKGGVDIEETGRLRTLSLKGKTEVERNVLELGTPELKIHP